jgi:hypothetical protein
MINENRYGRHEANVCLMNVLQSLLQASMAPLILGYGFKLIDEELKEVVSEAVGTTDHLKEMCDLLYVSTGLALTAVEHISHLINPEERDNVLKQQGKVSRTLESGFEYYGADTFYEAFHPGTQ